MEGERVRTDGEDVCKEFVRLFAMLVLRFALEPVRPVHLPSFVITTVDKHSVRV